MIPRIRTPTMLPTTVQFIIAMIASAITDRMARKLTYAKEEVRVLRVFSVEALSVFGTVRSTR